MKWKFTCLLFIAITFAAMNVTAQSITYYVSSDDGDDGNDGLSTTTAFETLQKAIVVMRNSDVQHITILVEGGRQYPFPKNGPYDNVADSTFRLFRNENNQAGKSLKVLGGYNFQTGTRDLVDDKTELKGRTVLNEDGGVNHVVSIGLVNSTADSLVIEGFKIREGDVAGVGEFEFVPGVFSSRRSGGGITIQGCNNNKIAIRNCDFEFNEKAVGGAVSVGGSNGINFQNCLFAGNRAIWDDNNPISGQGGAAYTAFSNVNFQGCLFFVNGLDSRLGSVMFISNSGGQTVKLVNCTVTDNRSVHPIFGSFYVDNGNLQIINSIVWNNNGSQITRHPSNNITITLTNTIHEWATDFGEDSKWNSAPGFLNPNQPSGGDGLLRTEDDGYSLTCTYAPALDGGNNAGWPPGLTVDMMGKPRIVADKIDVGAYEEQTSTVYEYWPDADGDGYGPAGVDPIRVHCTLSGYVEQAGDCDDNDNTVHPGAIETCGDGKDNDCNGSVDDIQLIVNYPDTDGDGYGNPAGPFVLFCGQEPGYSLNNLDCDDTNANIRPGAAEICDGIDNNCDGQTDEGFTKTNYYLDADGDGYGKTSDVIASCLVIAGRVTIDGDCDDNDNTINPGATEVCGDGKDNDCNGFTDNVPMIVLFPDVDGDGFGNPAGTPILACDVQSGYARNNTDCNDNDNAVHPNVTEICDGIDNNCNGQTDEGKLTYYTDADGDGYGSTVNPIESCTPVPDRITQGGDCDDNDNTIHPLAPEICDGKDNNCNGAVDNDFSHQLRWYRDSDSDGFGEPTDFVMNCDPVFGRVDNGDDCNDNDNTIYPNAPEFCDGKDNNCNAAVDESQPMKQYLDADGDGYGNPTNFMTSCSALAGRVLLAGDCNDNDNTIYPGVGGCAALPLTLVDFTVKEENQKAIASWTTTDEINTSHFELERSADGNNFQKIATVPAMNAPGDHKYSYVDAQPLSGKNYYRIKMVDIDGTYTYSRIASLNGAETRTISAIYPNPANDRVNVVIADNSNDLSIQLISLDRKVLQTKRFAVRGTHQLNITKLPAGIYFIKVSNGEIHKLIKQ